jgi:hypothetical protein
MNKTVSHIPRPRLAVANKSSSTTTVTTVATRNDTHSKDKSPTRTIAKDEPLFERFYHKFSNTVKQYKETRDNRFDSVYKQGSIDEQLVNPKISGNRKVIKQCKQYTAFPNKPKKVNNDTELKEYVKAERSASMMRRMEYSVKMSKQRGDAMNIKTPDRGKYIKDEKNDIDELNTNYITQQLQMGIENDNFAVIDNKYIFYQMKFPLYNNDMASEYMTNLALYDDSDLKITSSSDGFILKNKLAKVKFIQRAFREYSHRNMNELEELKHSSIKKCIIPSKYINKKVVNLSRLIRLQKIIKQFFKKKRGEYSRMTHKLVFKSRVIITKCNVSKQCAISRLVFLQKKVKEYIRKFYGKKPILKPRNKVCLYTKVYRNLSNLAILIRLQRRVKLFLQNTIKSRKAIKKGRIKAYTFSKTTISKSAIAMVIFLQRLIKQFLKRPKTNTSYLKLAQVTTDKLRSYQKTLQSYILLMLKPGGVLEKETLQKKKSSLKRPSQATPKGVAKNTKADILIFITHNIMKKAIKDYQFDLLDGLNGGTTAKGSIFNKTLSFSVINSPKGLNVSYDFSRLDSKACLKPIEKSKIIKIPNYPSIRGTNGTFIKRNEIINFANLEDDNRGGISPNVSQNISLNISQI